ncbi:MAG: hypothetical protein LUC41_03245, partial [Clostridiales bacterium]|nr:hypothetical protein [Clostridiales bacterium]
EKDSYRFLWLRFDYQDLRYIIVPNKKARDGVIDVICRIPDTGFAEDADVNLQKYRLISKILVLEEIGKDW